MEAAIQRADIDISFSGSILSNWERAIFLGFGRKEDP
jgi:hypothetical protein